LVVTCTIRANPFNPGKVLILSGELVNPGPLEVGVRVAGFQYSREGTRPSIREAGLGSGRAEPITTVIGEEHVAGIVVTNDEIVESVFRRVGEKGAWI